MKRVRTCGLNSIMKTALFLLMIVGLMSQNNLQFYEDQPIRTAWDEENEEWLFSIVDVVQVLTEQSDTRHAAKHWSVLKTRQSIRVPGGILCE